MPISTKIFSTTDIYLSWGYYFDGVIILQTRTEKTNTLALAFQKYHTLFFIFRESWYSLKNASCMTWYVWTKSSSHVSKHFSYPTGSSPWSPGLCYLKCYSVKLYLCKWVSKFSVWWILCAYNCMDNSYVWKLWFSLTLVFGKFNLCWFLGHSFEPLWHLCIKGTSSMTSKVTCNRSTNF